MNYQDLFDNENAKKFIGRGESTRAKQSATKKGKKPNNFNKKRTEESKLLISQNSPRRISVMTPKGKFHSLREAAKAYNVLSETFRYWLKSKPTEFYRIEEAA